MVIFHDTQYSSLKVVGFDTVLCCIVIWRSGCMLL